MFNSTSGSCFSLFSTLNEVDCKWRTHLREAFLGNLRKTNLADLIKKWPQVLYEKVLHITNLHKCTDKRCWVQVRDKIQQLEQALDKQPSPSAHASKNRVIWSNWLADACRGCTKGVINCLVLFSLANIAEWRVRPYFCVTCKKVSKAYTVVSFVNLPC